MPKIGLNAGKQGALLQIMLKMQKMGLPEFHTKKAIYYMENTKDKRLYLFEEFKKNKAHDEGQEVYKFAEYLENVDGEVVDKSAGQVVGFHDFVSTLSPMLDEKKKEKKSKYQAPPAYDGADSDSDLDFLNDGPEWTDPNSPEIRNRCIKLGGVPVV